MTTALKNKDVITLGHVQEINPMNFVDMGDTVQNLIAQIHIICLEEFMSRSVLSVWCWSRRVENIFRNNKINKLQDLLNMTLHQVNRLTSCGFKSRKEIYEIFIKEYNIKLHNWNPDHHWDKYLYDSKGKMLKED